MRDVRNTLIWTLALLLVVLGGDRLLSAVFDEVLRHSHFRFSELHHGGIDADILVLGDSRGVTSINVPAVERITGLRTFSLCYNGMATRIGEALLNDYLDHNRPPRLMIIEVTSLIEPMKLSPELRSYSGMSSRLAVLYAEEHPLAARVGEVFRLLRYNSELYLRALYYLRRSDQDWSNWGTISPEEVSRASTAPLWRLDATAENLDALERILRQLRSRNVEVRLVVAPYLPEYTKRAVSLDAFVAGVEARARRVDPALRVWNYAAAISEARLFADPLHLNNVGTEAFTRMLQRDGFFQGSGRVSL
jgi:hypothetical protein